MALRPIIKVMTRTAPRQVEYQPRQDRSGQPLAQVECTGCGLRFTTAAKSHTNCPDCRRNLRVHRTPQRPARPRQPRAIPVLAVRQQPAAVRQPSPSPTPPSWPRPAARDEDDDETYIRIGARLVLGIWTLGGQLIPATVLPAAYLARELPARNWRMVPHGDGICHIVRTWAAIADVPAAYEPCGRPAEHGPLCAKCFEALRTPA